MTAREVRKVFVISSYSVNLRYRAVKEELQKLGYDVETIGSFRVQGSVWELVLNILPNTVRALFADADVAIGFKPYPSVVLPLMLFRIRGIRTLIDVDDLDHGYRTGPWAKLLFWAQRPFVRYCDVILYHHRNLARYITTELRSSPDKLYRFPQGVDFQKFSASVDPAAQQAIVETYHLQRKKIAVFTAHLNVACNLDFVLTCWRHVSMRMEDVVLLVVGGGPMEGYYRDLTRKRGLSQVVFVGDVQHERVPTFLSIADIALLYLSEDVAANQYRCSLKLREYFAAGVKVLCNDVGELPEFAEYTYQSGSCIHEVTATIVDVLQKGGDGREKRAQRFARDHLQWRGLVENLTKTFGDIAR